MNFSYAVRNKIIWHRIKSMGFMHQTLFKISSFVFNRRKKFLQVWNNIKMSNK